MTLNKLCGLKHIKVENNDVFNFENMSLNSDVVVLKKLIDEKFLQGIGLVTANNLPRNPFWYSIESIERDYTEYELNEFADSASAIIQLFIRSLWFIKDNSVNMEPVYLYTAENGHVYSRTRHVSFSNCKGIYESVTFNINEFNEANKFLLKMIEYSTTRLENLNIPQSIIGSTKPSLRYYHDYNSNNRIDRAIDFLALARTNSLLAYKTSFYIPIYECLFTTDGSEVKHKVAERAASYLGENAQEKIEIYKLLSSAYALRSKYFHGQELEKKHKSLSQQMELSQKIDTLTRKLLRKILLEDAQKFLQKRDDLEEWFHSLIFE